MSTVEIPDPLPLRCIEPPAEVSRVDGCDCGGLIFHRWDCTIWDIPVAGRIAAVDTALVFRQRQYAREWEDQP